MLFRRGSRIIACGGATQGAPYKQKEPAMWLCVDCFHLDVKELFPHSVPHRELMALVRLRLALPWAPPKFAVQLRGNLVRPALSWRLSAATILRASNVEEQLSFRICKSVQGSSL